MEKKIKFFNIDKHISVIHDVKNILEGLGHTIDSWNLSNHTWVNSEKTKKISLLNRNKWTNINESICSKFYKKYKNSLADYDGFIHSYPPAFSLLFEKFNKPIVTICCTRLDFPVYPNNYGWLIDGLKRMHLEGQLIPVANNLLDKFYCEQETDFEWTHISSLCNYMKNRYQSTNTKFIAWTRSGIKLESNHIDKEFTILERYDRNEIYKKRGVIHIPYNLSIMSAFEHYRQNIPMFFPTPRFQEELWKNRTDILSEILFPSSKLIFNKSLIHLADWYDDNNFRSVTFFDNFKDLENLMTNLDLNTISDNMQKYNLVRESSIIEKWSRVMEKIK